MEKLGQADVDHKERQVVCISQDSFYRDLTPAEKQVMQKGQFNFDHPGKNIIFRYNTNLKLFGCYIFVLSCYFTNNTILNSIFRPFVFRVSL